MDCYWRFSIVECECIRGIFIDLPSRSAEEDMNDTHVMPVCLLKTKLIIFTTNFGR